MAPLFPVSKLREADRFKFVKLSAGLTSELNDLIVGEVPKSNCSNPAASQAVAADDEKHSQLSVDIKLHCSRAATVSLLIFVQAARHPQTKELRQTISEVKQLRHSITAPPIKKKEFKLSQNRVSISDLALERASLSDAVDKSQLLSAISPYKLF
ncbi:hypothetical protein JYU34_017563 [Plutella xylostella]|uniref:Uncharacterized protein n=1 Tax=Plutella xylostella TaxID=51655 RepID=A0ABQ7Q1N7_PLUXY|nr:hypothetical protein JYU34_017563 [Plutella xylostella]